MDYHEFGSEAFLFKGKEIFFGIYVDDIMMIGMNDAIYELEIKMKNIFNFRT